MTAALSKPVLGTGLTRGGALAIVSIAPVFWTVFAITWAALPA